MKSLIGVTFATLAGLAACDMPWAAQESPLRGTWTLLAADKILPSGERVHDYGGAPKGRMVVDAQGRYSLQIFKSERPRFATADKVAGSAEEFASAVLGSSTHYGVVVADSEQRVLTFTIEASSFPNWEGTVQKRQYTLEGPVLSYRVPPRPDGSVPISVWQKLD